MKVDHHSFANHLKCRGTGTAKWPVSLSRTTYGALIFIDRAIGVGNMLPSTVKLVCLDINPASVTKLLDRGSTQAAGLVSDIGTFLPLLSQECQKIY